MESLDFSDAALALLSPSELVKTAKELGLTVSQGDSRERTIQAIQALRDLAVNITENSGRRLEQSAAPGVPWYIYLWITVQAIVTAAFLSASLWWYFAEWIFSSFVDVYGLKGALEMRSWLDLLAFAVFLVLVCLWIGPARSLGPMYFYLRSSTGPRPSKAIASTTVEHTITGPTTTLTGECVGRSLPAPSRDGDDSNPSTTVDLTTDDLTSVPMEKNSCQPPPTSRTNLGPVTSLKGYDQSSEELGSSTERDQLQASLRKTTKVIQTAKGKGDASEEKVQKMQEEKEENKKRLQELESQMDNYEGKIRKMEEEKEENKKRPQELESQMDDSKAKIQKMQEEKEENKKRLQELESQMDNYEDKIRKMEEEKEENKKRPQELESQMDDTKAKIQKMQEEKEENKKRLQELESQMDNYEDKIRMMQKEQEDNREELQRMQSQANTFEERTRRIQEEAQKEKDQLVEEAKKERDILMAELVRLRGKVWTYLRFRPKINGDKETQYIDLKSPNNPRHSVILPGGIDKISPKDTHYEFDRVFHHTDSNRDIFEDVRPMVRAAMEEGLDVAIILDGPSGSGKSYTMFESPDGLAFTIANHIFQRMRAPEGSSRRTEVKLSTFKVYMEKVLDGTIKSKDAVPLYVREGKDTRIQVYRDKHYKTKVDGKLVSNKQELVAELKRMLRVRDQRQTAQNSKSSRGHAICKLEFSSFNMETKETKISSIFLVDLAGPEKYEYKSPTSTETKTINAGRDAIHRCLCEMIQFHQLNPNSPGRKDKFENLRRMVKQESELTHVLQDCFLGEPRITVIGTVNPYAADEHRPRIRDTLEFVTKLRNYDR